MPRGLISDEKGIDKFGEGGGGICTRQGDFLGPRTQILEKNTWNFRRFFSSPLFFYECSPYQKVTGRSMDTRLDRTIFKKKIKNTFRERAKAYWEVTLHMKSHQSESETHLIHSGLVMAIYLGGALQCSQ